MAERRVALAIDEICRGSDAVFAVAGVRCAVPGHPFGTLSTPFVKPGTRVVRLVLRVPARKDASQILGVLEIFGKNERSVGVMDDVLTKVFPVFENVMNEPSKKQDVRPGTQRRPDICHRRSPAEPRVNVNHLCSALSRFHDPLETDRVILRHVGTHDQNGVRVQEVAWRGCRSPSAKGCAQTGHG